MDLTEEDIMSRLLPIIIDDNISDKVDKINDLGIELGFKNTNNNDNLAQYIIHSVLYIDTGRPRQFEFEYYDGFLVLHFYTRTGGGNSEEYERENNNMKRHFLYIESKHDDTYIDWYYDLEKFAKWYIEHNPDILLGG